MPSVHIINSSRTGNFTTTAIDLESRNIQVQITTTIGATPTVTIKIQGSLDGINFNSMVFIDDNDTAQAKVVSATITTATTKFYTKANSSYYRLYQVDFSANTNVTITSVWIGGDSTS